MLCLIIKLHNHSVIYFSILFVFNFFHFSLIVYNMFIIVSYMAVYVYIMYCALNK